jgi:hypothetical protein
MIDVAEVEGRVREALHRKAEQIDSAAPGFSSDTVAVIELADARRPARRAVYAAASVVAVLLVGVGILFATTDDTGRGANPSPSLPPTAPPVTGSGGAGALAPGFVPEGLDLWNVTAAPQFETAFALSYTTQLFGVVDDAGAPSPGLLLRIQRASGTATGDPVTVRGVAGSSAAPKEGVETSETISWNEGGAMISATVRGMTRGEAVAALDALRPRSADLQDGFDAGSLPLLGETLAKREHTASVRGRFDYAPAPVVGGDSPKLQVVTATSADFPGYLGFWIEGKREADGSVVKRDPGWGLDVAWPDGRQVLVYSDTDDWSVLERVARSVKPVTEAELDELRHGVNARLAALPVIVSAGMSGQSVELRGAGAPAALCFDLGAEKRCGSPYGQFGGGTDEFSVSAIVDGSWRLVYASRVPVHINGADAPGGRDLAQHVTVNGWDFAFADPPDDLSQVTIVSGPEYTQGMGLPRPDR